MSQIDIPCLILAGGRSARFGAAKGLAPFAGTTLLDFVMTQFTAALSAPVAVNASPDGPYAGRDFPRVADKIPGQQGPLAGILTAMIWASELGYDRVYTLALDMPFLPTNWAELLALSNGNAAAADHTGRCSICGIWRTDQAAALQASMDAGMRAYQAWCEIAKIAPIKFERADGIDPLFNINTRQDLQAAETALQGARR